MTHDKKSKFIDTVKKMLINHVNENRKDIEDWIEDESYGDYNPDRAIKEIIHRDLGSMFDKGYTVQDAFDYLTHTEEIDPRIPEDDALRAMDGIARKYNSNGKQEEEMSKGTLHYSQIGTFGVEYIINVLIQLIYEKVDNAYYSYTNRVGSEERVTLNYRLINTTIVLIQNFLEENIDEISIKNINVDTLDQAKETMEELYAAIHQERMQKY